MLESKLYTVKRKKKEKGYFASGYMEQKIEYDGYTKQ